MTYSRRKMLFASGAVICASGMILFAATDGFGFFPQEYDASPVFVEDGFAIRGYDPVAYFTHREPRAGHEAHQYNWNRCDLAVCKQPAQGNVCCRPKEIRPSIRWVLRLGDLRKRQAVLNRSFKLEDRGGKTVPQFQRRNPRKVGTRYSRPY